MILESRTLKQWKRKIGTKTRLRKGWLEVFNGLTKQWEVKCTWPEARKTAEKWRLKEERKAKEQRRRERKKAESQ